MKFRRGVPTAVSFPTDRTRKEEAVEKAYQIFNGSDGLVSGAAVTDQGEHFAIDLQLAKEPNLRSVTSGWLISSARWHQSGANRLYGLKTEIDGDDVPVSGTRWAINVRKTHPMGWFDQTHQGLLAASGVKVDIKRRRDLWLVIIDPIAQYMLKPREEAIRLSKKGTTVDLRLWNTPEGLAWQLDLQALGKKQRGVRLEFIRHVNIGEPTREILANLAQPGSNAGTIQPFAPQYPYLFMARKEIAPSSLFQTVPFKKATEGWILCDPGPKPAEGSPGINVGDGYRLEIVMDRIRHRDIRKPVWLDPVYGA